MDRELPTPPADVKALIERLHGISAKIMYDIERLEGVEPEDLGELLDAAEEAEQALSSLGTGWRPTREQIARALARYYHPDEPNTPDLWELYYPEADIFLALTPEAE